MELKQQEEVVGLWLPIIKHALVHFGVSGTDFDDLSQEIITQVLDKNYPAIYDPKKSNLSTFIFSMVRKRLFQHRSCSGRDALKHSTLVGEDQWIMEGKISISEDPEQYVSNKEFWELVVRVRAELAKLPRRRPYVKEGRVVSRSVADVFDLLVKEHTQAEISRILEYSEGTLSILVQVIRKHPESQKLFSAYRGTDKTLI